MSSGSTTRYIFSIEGVWWMWLDYTADQINVQDRVGGTTTAQSTAALTDMDNEYRHIVIRYDHSEGYLATFYDGINVSLDSTVDATSDGTGVIYFGESMNRNGLYALNPNGTLKWRYQTNHVVYSSPAIGDDGTVYCGSHDGYLYALYPNNGTLKWKFPTNNWIRTAPCIADDGTIYVVSLDNHLYAINPNGTLKWKTNMGHAGTSPTIGQDGTIYCGYTELFAIDPVDGSVEWTFDVGGTIQGGTPCNSIDGTIYLGTHIGETDGGELIAVNPDGTERWRIKLATVWIMSAPAIGEDGTVYIGSCNGVPPSTSWGYLHAIGYPGPNPLTPDINGPTSGKPGTSYDYTFTSIDPDVDDVQFFIDWGDGDTEWTSFAASGTPVTRSHTWSEKGTYVIRAKAKDTDDYESDWGTLTVTMPRNRLLTNTLFMSLLERFPNAFPILRYLLEVNS